MQSKLLKLAIPALGLLLASCNDGAPPAGGNAPLGATILARVDGEAITASQLTAAIEAVPKPDRLDYLAAEARLDLLQSLIDRKLMAREALRLALAPPPMATDSDPLAAEQRRAQAYLDTQLAELPGPTEQDIETYYSANTADFLLPERIQVTRLVFPDRSGASAARVAAEEGAALASLGDGRLRPTTLWLQRRPGEPNDFEAAAFATPVGTLGPLVAVERGFCLFRVEDRQAAEPLSLAEARPAVIVRLQSRQRAELLQAITQRLRNAALIDIDSQALDAFNWEDSSS